MDLITSYSSLTGYLQCARKWYLGEVLRLGLKVEKRTGPLGFGSRVHVALERGWKESLPAVEVWRELMQDEYLYYAQNELLTFDLAKEDKLGLTMLEGLQQWQLEEGEDQEYEILGVEVKLSNHLLLPNGVEVLLRGKLDQILRHRETGEIRLKDWKTSKDQEESFKNSIEQSSQPRLYTALLQQDADLVVSGIRYTVLRKVLRGVKAKPPFYFNYDLDLHPYNVDQHLRRAIAVTSHMVDTVKKLEEGADHTEVAPFNPGWWCGSCPFKAPCSLMQHTSMEAAAQMLEDLYKEMNPFERYGQEEEEKEE